jgi:spore coat polysaccharide biosynthesis protein SpsF
MRTLGIVQARMGSSRLPGKVLRRLGGRTVLDRVVRAASASGVLDDLVVATTVQDADDAVAAECDAIGVACHRGPVDDVLTRFIGVLDARELDGAAAPDAVLRFTADCPLLDPEIITLAANVFAAAPRADYLSTSITRTLPRGLDVEVVRTPVLRAVDDLATEHHRTHVTSYVYAHPERFTVLGLTLQPDLSHLRLTLDTEDDWRLIESIVEHFGDRAVPVRDLAGWLAEHPELILLNGHVRQKALAEA